MSNTAPPQGLLFDSTLHSCPYLAGRTAQLPLRWYSSRIAPEDFDALLALSDRRVGRSLYRPSCPACEECKGIRVPTATFEASRSQRRAARKNLDLTVHVGPVTVDSERVALFNKHKQMRDLGEADLTQARYREWLVSSCTETVETQYRIGDKLVGVGVVDLGRRSASSVYFYFDPDHEDRSLGVFSVLAEIAWLRSQGFEYYYLGLYVADCAQLNYKARYYPHERLVDGRWVRFEAPP